MTDLNIIYGHGLCRGRPPTGSNNREGPAGSRQSAVSSQQSDVGCCMSEVIRQRIGFRCREPVLIPASLIATSAKRRWGERKISDFRFQNSEFRNRKSGTHFPLARGWPNITCSVRLKIARDRDNDRLIATTELAEIAQIGKSIPYYMYFRSREPNRQRAPGRSVFSLPSLVLIQGHGRGMPFYEFINRRWRKNKFSRARDLPTFTCSVRQVNIQDRDNNSLRESFMLAKSLQTGRGMPGAKLLYAS